MPVWAVPWFHRRTTRKPAYLRQAARRKRHGDRSPALGSRSDHDSLRAASGPTYAILLALRRAFARRRSFLHELDSGAGVRARPDRVYGDRDDLVQVAG